MKAILSEVLAEIKPSRSVELAVKKKTDAIISKIKKALPDTNVILGGSGAKGTWLKDAHDADIFVQFPATKYQVTKISSLLGSALRKHFKIKKLHGSRDYYQIIIDNFTYEIVPIIEIKSADDALNITDVSPLHSKWVKKHSKLADEIRLTKQFFKAARVYGAESYINGFSGYICEILTIHYGGFSKTVKEIAKWRAQVIIDPQKYYKGKSVSFELNESKRQGPLIVIDPVQKSRNAAAAVSTDKFEEIIAHAKQFLQKPSIKFFQAKTIQILPKAKEELFTFIVKPLSGKEDIVGCKMLKAFSHIKRELTRFEFSIVKSEWEWSKTAKFYLILRKEKLSEKKIISGPPKTKTSFVTSFKKKHKETYIDNGQYFALEKRTYRQAQELLTTLTTDPYVLERVKSIDLL